MYYLLFCDLVKTTEFVQKIQVCGDDGSRFLKGIMALCVVHDSGLEL